MSNLLNTVGKHRADPRPNESTEPEAVGSDGLSETQRRALTARFRSGIGSRPGATEAARRSAEMAEKLSQNAVIVPRR